MYTLCYTDKDGFRVVLHESSHVLTYVTKLSCDKKIAEIIEEIDKKLSTNTLTEKKRFGIFSNNRPALLTLESRFVLNRIKSTIRYEIITDKFYNYTDISPILRA